MSYQYEFLQTITRESLAEEMEKIKEKYESNPDLLSRICLIAEWNLLVSVALEKFDIRKDLKENHLKNGKLKDEEIIQLMSDYIEILKQPQ